MPEIKKVPFEFHNESKEGKHILTLSGVIQKRYWSDDKYIDAKLIRDNLDGVTDDVVIRLNSNGGDVFQGVEIYNYLKNHSSHITVEVMATAASAATFICAGADEVIMNVGTSFMIHEAETVGWGNKTDIKKTLQALETIDDSILSIYAEKTGQSKDQITTWINEARWFTADEAVEFGFANSVKRAEPQEEPQDIASMIQDAVAVAMANLSQPVTNQVEQEPKPKSLIARLRKGE